ncbi:MAG: TolC family protein [Bacteroides sp.]|jgi:outer membrane protein|nr:TolC family protein [Bacteroides sp.]
MMQPIRKKGLFFLLSFILFPGLAVNGQDPWSLKDCVDHALKNNIQIKQQKLSVEIAEENLLQTRANQLPSINANASHGYNFGRTIDPFTNEFATETVRSNNFSLSTGLNLFSGLQVRNTIAQNRHELEASRFDVEKIENDISLAVASAYLQILFARELVEVTASNLEVSRQQVDHTRRLVEAGTLARGSLYTIEAQAASEELQLVNAENQLDIAYLNLAQLLDLEDYSNFEIEVPEIEIETFGETEHSPLQIYTTAVNSQPEVRSAELRVASAERGVKIAQGGRSPMLSFRGNYGTGYSGASREITDVMIGEPQQIGETEGGEPVFAPSLDYLTQIKPFGDQLEDNLNRSLAFVLTIPIFNNFQTKASISRSRIALENANLNQQLVRVQFFKNVQQAHADAQAALKRYTATIKNVQALEEAFRYTEQRFSLGMVNSLEYNDAKNRLSAAQSDLLQSKYEYVFRTKVLDFYLGVPLSL